MALKNWADIWGDIWGAIWAEDGPAVSPTPLPTVTSGRAHTLLLKRKRAGLK